MVAIHPTLSRWIEGVPVDLVRRGEIDQAACRAQNVSAADLDEAVRQAGVESVSAADRMTLEPSSRLTLRRSSRRASRRDGDRPADG